jgi:hypothetical protein
VRPTNIPNSIAEAEPDTSNLNGLGFEDPLLWEDSGEIMNQEDSDSLARLRALHEKLIQKQR